LGNAKGLEVYIRRRLTHRLGGYIAYTYSRSTRSVGNEHFLSTFDRPHVANAALAYNLGRNWRAGSRLTIYSGLPVQPDTTGLVSPPRSMNPDRDPAFYRLDVRAEKRWTWGKSTWLSFVTEVMNVTMNKETVLGQRVGPVTIPSIGVEVGF
jgi:hypothetical protein